ncbi:unnamed protein product [Coregonus sp. 'balchen']|nr:unnamed protein product [Coregonus sp. 'balchen']
MAFTPVRPPTLTDKQLALNMCTSPPIPLLPVGFYLLSLCF